MFHYLFPPLTIGMGAVLVFLEYRWLRTDDPIYHAASRFWTKMFGINFALGVATGIVMEFEFGTNWAVYSRYVGDVFGSALAAYRLPCGMVPGATMSPEPPGLEPPGVESKPW